MIECVVAELTTLGGRLVKSVKYRQEAGFLGGFLLRKRRTMAHV